MKKKVFFLLVFICLLTSCTEDKSVNEYTREMMEQLLMEGKESTLEERVIIVNEELFYVHGISDENFIYYNTLLQKLDQMIKEGEYQIISVFEVHRGKESMRKTSYVLHIVSNEFLDFYHSWKTSNLLVNPDDPENPFVSIITISDSGIVTGNYQSIAMGYQWRLEIQEEFYQIFPNYYMNIENIRLFDYDVLLDADFNGDWKEIHQEIEGGNRINIFVPFGTSEESIHQSIKENESFFKAYFVNQIVVIELNETDTFEMIQEQERIHQNSYAHKTEEFPAIVIYVMK